MRLMLFYFFFLLSAHTLMPVFSTRLFSGAARFGWFSLCFALHLHLAFEDLDTDYVHTYLSACKSIFIY